MESCVYRRSIGNVICEYVGCFDSRSCSWEAVYELLVTQEATDADVDDAMG